MKAPEIKKRPKWMRLLAVFFNPWFWKTITKWILRSLFPQWFPSIEIYKAPPDAALMKLDGKTSCRLAEYIAQSHDMPVILNIGSYN
jgi:hypothetical protein